MNSISMAEFRSIANDVNATVPVPTVESIRLRTVDAIRSNVERGVSITSDEELEERINRIMDAPLHPARIVE